MTDLAERIRIAGTRVGGLNRLAVAIDVPRRTLGNWLRGVNPKPEALRKIAAESGVSLDWLLSGEGHPDDDGMAVSLRHFDRKQMDELAAARKADEEYGDGLAKALELIQRKLYFAPPPMPETVTLRRRIIELVRLAHSEAGIAVRDDDVAVIAMEMFATLTQRVKDLGDAEEVDLVVTHLLHNLRSELVEAKKKPGSGKPSASSL